MALMEKPPASRPMQERNAAPRRGEEDAYQRLVMAGAMALYSDETHESVMEMIRSGGDDPAESLANAVATIVMEMFKKSGGKIPRSVILPASIEVLALAAELAEAAGIYEINEQTVQRSTQLLQQKLMQMFGGGRQPMQQQAPAPAQQMPPQGGGIMGGGGVSPSVRQVPGQYAGVQ